jgi:sirohydrochlorin ferrochelatase
LTYLLVVAHGSRRDESNLEVGELIARLRTNCSLFSGIDYAFLEIARPSIHEALRQQIAQGADEIIVMPYFLSAGRHVVADIPEQVEQIRAETPTINIKIAPYLGASNRIDDLVIHQALSACD